VRSISEGVVKGISKRSKGDLKETVMRLSTQTSLKKRRERDLKEPSKTSQRDLKETLISLS